MARTDKSLNRIDESGPLAERIPGVGVTTPEVLAEILAEGKLSRRFHTIEVGHHVIGTLLGRGAPVEVKQADGDYKPSETWDIDVGEGVTIGILTSHQLESDLPKLVGRRVFIGKGEQKSVGARRVNQFIVSDLDAKRLGPPPAVGASLPSMVAQ